MEEAVRVASSDVTLTFYAEAEMVGESATCTTGGLGNLLIAVGVAVVVWENVWVA